MRNPQHDTLGSPKTETGASPEKGSERRCVLTGQTGSRDAFLRLAISPDGHVLPDALAKAPGRGAWIGVSRAELEEAISAGRLKGALSRAFKSGDFTVPENLGAQMQSALEKAFLQRLGLEMRSGRLILGSDRIRDDARMGKVAALFHARDASEDGCKKLDQAYRVGLDAEGSGVTGTRLPLDREALSVALGRENVVHMALADTRSAERVAIPLGRLQTFLVAAPAAGTSDGAGVMTGADAHE
ncbi:DUF448 domain-containing protein [Aurantiacibacter sediminis]|uniref:DUF448 domain-containing protein n=1 Tax=Aurantiacibacter sediminis TaxID=2793064 RepID=A0ABS0N606_9SPHN|nr:DUF448 domain-containing protein [Aurantiacibacter sediminis]MBH5323203.1 DUF448 domain-containing protein [Aurantiacibacter sediminis]